jgi:hypothetical protein
MAATLVRVLGPPAAGGVVGPDPASAFAQPVAGQHGGPRDGGRVDTRRIRRARLNLRHSFERGRFALSFGGQNNVTVKDAYFDLFLTAAHGQRQGLTLRSGQFFRPFGFEIERPATDREFPERPTGWGVLFPGNRDQGFDLSLGATPALTLNAAVVNGGGTSTSTLSFRDADDHKDVMARVRYALFSPRIDLAASIYRGQQTIAGTAATAALTGFVDLNGNGVKDAGEATVVVTPARAAVPAVEGDRNRWSFAANVYDLLGGTVRAEYVGADEITTNLGTGPSRGTAPAPPGTRSTCIRWAGPIASPRATTSTIPTRTTRCA